MDKASWINHTLSYAGRLQLIKSILFCIQVYWSSLFIILKAIIVKITSLLLCFLWNGSDLASSGAKVAWDKIYLPKEKGGLGMKNQEVWDICTRPAHSI
jgi:hypothetical protein